MTTSYALVPVEAYDTQVTRLIQQMGGTQTPGPESESAQNIAAIKATIKNICLEGAISLLDAFGYKGDEFHCDNAKWKVYDLADENYFPGCQGRMAKETPKFWFWGGPPTKLKWYRGTLQTLLEDRVLSEIVQRGAAEIARWVGTDLQSVKTGEGT